MIELTNSNVSDLRDYVDMNISNTHAMIDSNLEFVDSNLILIASNIKQGSIDILNAFTNCPRPRPDYSVGGSGAGTSILYNLVMSDLREYVDSNIAITNERIVNNFEIVDSNLLMVASNIKQGSVDIVNAYTICPDEENVSYAYTLDNTYLASILASKADIVYVNSNFENINRALATTL
jgi:hypothetical protein